MTEPFLGTIQLFAFNFAPRNWATCDGQTLAISSNQALFALLGTAYGGDGIRTFGLPDLRGRTPISYGTPISGPTYVMGEKSGEEQHRLLLGEIPSHTHTVMTDSKTLAQNNSDVPTTGSVLGQSTGWDTSGSGSAYAMEIYNTGNNPNDVMAPQSLGSVGGSTSHENRMPYLVMNFSIALQGIFPSRS